MIDYISPGGGTGIRCCNRLHFFLMKMALTIIVINNMDLVLILCQTLS